MEIIYETYFKGDGSFNDTERNSYIEKALKTIKLKIEENLNEN